MVNPFEKRIQEKTNENKNPFQKRLQETNPDNYITDEEVERDIERVQSQFFSRIGESILGAPGDIVNFAGSLFGKDLGFPGSQELRKFSEKATGGYTSPKNPREEKTGELFSDIASFSLPGSKHVSFFRNVGIPIVSNLIKEGLSLGGVGESKQNYAKVGTSIVLDVLTHRKNLGSTKKLTSSLFQKAEDLIPKGMSISGANLESSMNKLEKTLKKGGKRPSTADALEKIKELKKDLKGGKIELKNLMEYRKSINELIDKYNGFEIATTPKIREKVIKNLNRVKGEVINNLEEYGKKFNPEFLKTYQAANQSYEVFSKSNKITNFIKKHANSKLKSVGAKALFGLGYASGSGIAGATMGSPVGLGAAAGTALGYKTLKTILRSRDKTIRKNYRNIIEGSLKGNIPQVVKNAKALDEKLQKEESNHNTSQ